jgi:hypothetical protein
LRKAGPHEKTVGAKRQEEKRSAARQLQKLLGVQSVDSD